jgi:hypothetical protein
LQHLRAHGVADVAHHWAPADLEELGVLKRGGNGRDVGGQEPVGATEHGILFVQKGGQSEHARGHDGGKGRITSKTDDDMGSKAAKEAEGAGHAAHERGAGFGGRAQRACRQGGGGKAMDRASWKVLAIASTARIGDEIDRQVTATELLGQRKSRKQMAAGAPRGQNDRRRPHARHDRADP